MAFHSGSLVLRDFLLFNIYLLFIEVQFTTYKINYFKVNSVPCSTFKILCDRHLLSNPKAFLSPQNTTHCPPGSENPVPSAQVLATSNLLSVPLVVPILGVSYK